MNRKCSYDIVGMLMHTIRDFWSERHKIHFNLNHAPMYNYYTSSDNLFLGVASVCSPLEVLLCGGYCLGACSPSVVRSREVVCISEVIL